MGKRILLIDDERSFVDGRATTVARDVESAITALQDGEWDEVWIDFILKHGEDTAEIAWWLRKRFQAGEPNVGVKTFYFHSSAWMALSLMQTILEPAGYEVVLPASGFVKEFIKY